ncbi:MAG: hypothetical protein P8Y42_19400 [Exilibacterium sp.]
MVKPWGAFILYRDDISPGKKCYRTEYNRLNKFARQSIASISFDELTQKHLYDWIDTSLKTLQPSSVNRDLNLLSPVFKLAVDRN